VSVSTTPTTVVYDEGDPFATAGRRSLRSRFATSDAILAAAAAVLLPLGLLVILLGWYGAAHTPYLFEQVPYAISGGMVGLGLVIAGGLLFFGSWIARSSAAQQASSEEVIALLQEIRDGLALRDEPAPRQVKGGSNGKSGRLVATATGSMLHRPDCSVVTGRSGLKTVSESSGLQPCGLCDPLSTGETLPRQTVSRQNVKENR
jgi:hypothetical protein